MDLSSRLLATCEKGLNKDNFAKLLAIDINHIDEKGFSSLLYYVRHSMKHDLTDLKCLICAGNSPTLTISNNMCCFSLAIMNKYVSVNLLRTLI